MDVCADPGCQGIGKKLSSDNGMIYISLKEYFEKSLISLKEYFDKSLLTLKDQFQAQDERAEKNLLIAKDALEKRLEGMNEFRDTLKDQAANFITKAEYESVRNDIRELREAKARLEGKADQFSVNIVMGISILGLLTSIISIVIHWFK